MNLRAIAAGFAIFLAPAIARAQGEALTIDREPVLRVTAGGPTAFVTSLAFGAGGQALYAGGYDKVLHVWAANAQGQFASNPSPYRLPIGPGIDGAINAVAVSPEGTWIAAAGRGMLQHGGVASDRQFGIWIAGHKSMSAAMWEDQGVIHVFNTRTGNAIALRGHRGAVLSLAFAPTLAGKATTLVSYAREFGGKEFTGGVRLWDVDQAKELANWTTLPDPVTPKRTHWPRLVAWHTGKGALQFRIALAAEDGDFRWWDADANNPITTTADGDWNGTIAHLPAPDRLLTGSYSANRGVIKLWNMAGNAPAVARQMNLAEGHKPRALTAFPSKVGGAPDRAAIIAEAAKAGAPTDYFLYLIDLATLKTLREPVKLWNGPTVMPVLAVSPDGRSVAAAGNKDHEVHVFAVADLLKNQDAPQRLRGAGVTVQRAAFVRKGPDNGILLSETPRTAMGQLPNEPAKGELTFDLTARALTTDPGWKLNTPTMTGWEVQPSVIQEDGRARTQLLVLHNKQPQGTVRLGPGVFLTEYALLPPVAQNRPPLLAVASTELGQALLSIYDVRTGEHLRQLTGHVNRIHSLAFSGDGRLLVSTAEDQIICVWSLTDIDAILGRKGMLRGLGVTRHAGQLVLEEIDRAQLSAANRAALANAKVQEGDGIDGFVEKGKLRPIATLIDFYDSILLLKPGQPVTLRFRQKGDVSLIVGQVTDEHKPLFSLFITRGSGVARNWIGWNPVGPYDSSGRDAERLLGWHTNTGEDKQPATFALAREHHDANYRQDILKYLAKTGSVGQAIDAWKKDHPEKVREPKMTVWINEPGSQTPMDAQGRIIVRVPPTKLFLSIYEPPLGKIESIRWQVGTNRGEFTADGPDTKEWSADLSKLALGRGEHRIRVTLVTAAPDSQEYQRESFVTYQPPSPVVKALAALPRVVDKAEYRLQVEVLPAEAHIADIRLSQRHEGKERVADKPLEAKEKTRIDRTLKLEPGLNQIRLVARNQDAPAGSETNALSLDVLYKTPRPLITLSGVQPVPIAIKLPVDADRAEPVIVTTPRVRIVGEIEALGKITEATWATGDRAAGEKRTPLPGEKTNRLAIAQEVALTEPGKPLKVRFQAKTAGSDEAERAVTVVYQPGLPELRITSPVAEQPFIEGKDLLPLTVEGRLTWPPGQHPCTAQLLINDKPQGAAVTIDGKTTSLTIPATLVGGENDIRIRLKNDWREQTTSPVSVRYRKPPRIVGFTGPKKSAKPFVDVTAEVETGKSLPLTQITIKGNTIPASAIKPARIEEKGDTTLLQYVLRDLPLQTGSNRIELMVNNADGPAVKPGVVEIELEPPPEPRAEVSILDPQQNIVVEAEQYTVEFRVRSQSLIRLVELQRGSERIWHRTDFGDVAKSADGTFEVRGRQTVPLLPGPNSIKLVASNAGGEQVSPSVVITFRSVPVRVRIEGLLEQNAVTPGTVLADNTLVFQTGGDRVRLQGQVEWGANNDEAMRRVTHVRITVNGFQQLPAVLDTAKGKARSRTFRADIALTRAKGNEVAVRVVELAQEEGSRTRCVVDSTQPGLEAPASRQAHLLIVDASKNADEKQAVSRVLQALQATAIADNRFRKDGFADGRLYGPLVGDDVTPEKVYYQLAVMQKNLQRRAEAGANNDMVFVYFRGGETIDAQGHFFRTTDPVRDPELRWSGIPCRYFQENITRNLGAQLVLLDVVREPSKLPPGPDQVTAWPDDPYVAIVRYAWTGSPQTQTAEARLVSDWSAAAPGAHKLGDIARQLAAKFVRNPTGNWQSIKFASQLTYFALMPAMLEELPLTKR